MARLAVLEEALEGVAAGKGARAGLSLANAPAPGAARAFLATLATPGAQAILSRGGIEAGD